MSVCRWGSTARPQYRDRREWAAPPVESLPSGVLVAARDGCWRLPALAVRARRNKAQTGSEGMIGETGAAVTELAPEGKVFVHGEYWDAVSSRQVAAGARVRVTAIDRLKLTVEPIPEQTGG